MDIVVGILGAGIGAGIMQIVNTVVNHKMQKDDTEDERISAIMGALKVMIIDRIHFLVTSYIARGSVTLDEKETIQKMYLAFKAVGGNGDCTVPMEELAKLPVIDD